MDASIIILGLALVILLAVGNALTRRWSNGSGKEGIDFIDKMVFYDCSIVEDGEKSSDHAGVLMDHARQWLKEHGSAMGDCHIVTLLDGKVIEVIIYRREYLIHT